MEIIKKLWKGDVSLFITFWIFGVIPSTILRGLFYYLDQNPLLFNFKFGEPLFYLLFSISLIYSFFLWICIWRSANKYKGAQDLAACAKLAVILGAFSTFVNSETGILNNLIKNKDSYLQQLQKTVIGLNQNLPKKLDENTELQKITLDSNNVTYHFRLITLNKSQSEYLKFNLNSVKTNINKHVIENACNNNDVKDLLSHNINLNYHYENEGSELFNIPLTKNSCIDKR